MHLQRDFYKMGFSFIVVAHFIIKNQEFEVIYSKKPHKNHSFVQLFIMLNDTSL